MRTVEVAMRTDESPRLAWRTVRRFAATVALFMGIGASTALAQTNCPNAHPDGSDATQALQTCLNAGGTVILTANATPGYYVSQTLNMMVAGTTLTSDNGCCARIVAAPNLLYHILQDVWIDNVTIRNIWFDGNNAARYNTGSLCSNPQYGNQVGANLAIHSNNFTFDNTASINAVCGSALQVEGYNPTITNSFFAANGFELASTPWNAVSDGLTVWGCDGGGTITGNIFSNNTDIDLIVGRGTCTIHDNQITHDSRYGVGGLMVGLFGGSGDHNGMTMYANTVVSGNNLLSYGIMVGNHPWDPRSIVANAGSVTSNSSQGAVVNLAIDGIAAGYIQGNAYAGAQGTRGYPICSLAADYTAAHFGSSSYQGGSTCRYYDAPNPCVTPNPPCPPN